MERRHHPLLGTGWGRGRTWPRHHRGRAWSDPPLAGIYLLLRGMERYSHLLWRQRLHGWPMGRRLADPARPFRWGLGRVPPDREVLIRRRGEADVVSAPRRNGSVTRMAKHSV